MNKQAMTSVGSGQAALPSSVPPYFRKVCCNTGLFARVAPCSRAERLSAVVLLNSPSNSAWDFEEYLRLYRVYRGGSSGAATAAAPHVSDDVGKEAKSDQENTICYFICADGAYETLARYMKSQKSEATRTTDEVTSGAGCEQEVEVPCDVIIGDMDSFNAASTLPQQQQGEEKEEEGSSGSEKDRARRSRGGTFQKVGPYGKVKAVPEEVLAVVRERAVWSCKRAAAAPGATASHAGTAVASSFYSLNTNRESFGGIHGEDEKEQGAAQPLLLLHVTCQMTSDFDKCVLLLQRLQRSFPGDFCHYSSPCSLTPCSVGAAEYGVEDSATDASHKTPVVDGSDVASMLELCVRASQEAKTASDADKVDGYNIRNSGSSNSADAPLSDEALERDRIASLTLNVVAAPASSLPLLPSACSTTSSLLFSTGGEPQHVLHTVVLPTIAVLGALGGRIDHEMAATGCILRFAREFHLVLTNRGNVIFACWPDGVTQWVATRWVATPALAGGSTEVPVKEDNSIARKDAEADMDGGEGALCGVIPFGFVREIETAGLIYNMVKGRPDRCDAFTHTEKYAFTFDGILSTSNLVSAPVVTVDLRPLHHHHSRSFHCCTPASHTEATQERLVDVNESTWNATVNPPTIVTCNRV